MTSKQQVKSNQKMIYNKDSNLNTYGDASIIGLFKSTSNLSKSLRQQNNQKDDQTYKNQGNYTEITNKFKSSLSNSGKMIMESNQNSNFLAEKKSSYNQSNNLNNSNNQNNSTSFINLNLNSQTEKDALMNINKTQKNPPKQMRNNIEIRNLTHFYDKIETHQETYDLLFLLKSDKRMRHLDRLDDFVILKNNFLNALDDKINRKFDVLQSKLKSSKKDLENQLNKTDDDLIAMLLRDIDYLQVIQRNILNGRQDDITNAIKTVDQFNQDSVITIDNYINQLKNDLIDIGFMLDTEIDEICEEKKLEKQKYFETKRDECKINFELIQNEEIVLVEESKKTLTQFILRWKNVKLKRHVKELKDVFASKEFVDNSERYELIKNLRKDQENIYTQRFNLIISKMLNMSMEDITVKAIESINKELDDIYNNAQNLFDLHTQRLMNNSEKIYDNSLREVEKFKEKIKKISYEFGKDNKDLEILVEGIPPDEQNSSNVDALNNSAIDSKISKVDETNKKTKASQKDSISQKNKEKDNKLLNKQGSVVSQEDKKSVNDNASMKSNSDIKKIQTYMSVIKLPFLVEEYKTLNSIDELIDMEIYPLLDFYKNERKNYITNIINYLDDYDEYINNNCVRLVNTLISIGKKNDANKKNRSDKEKKYLLEMAKAADNDDDIIYEKEESLKKLSTEIKESFHLEDLDKNLENSFNIINELEVEYREYFGNMEILLNSHEDKINEDFHLFESEVLNIFGIRSKDKMEEVTLRRNQESEFLTKKKERELQAQAELEQEELKKEGKNAPKKKATPKKKGEPSAGFIAPRDILPFNSKLNHEYIIDFTIPELVKNILRNIIYNREDDILGLKSQVTNPTSDNAELISRDNSPTKDKTEKSETAQKSENIKDKQQNSGSNKDKKEINQKGSVKKDTTIREASLISNDESPMYDNFNPYEASTEKEFFSPISSSGDKLLSEENKFTEDFLIEIYTDLFNRIIDKITEDLRNIVENAKSSDNEKREELLTELDIRLKSLAPRKGKIEVEEYDKRLNEIEKHKEKYSQHLNLINTRNQNDNNECNNLTKEISNEFDELNLLYEKLSKVMEEEINLKSLDDKFKKFKSSYYDLNTNLQEAENKLLTYTKDNPEVLINLNKNFISSLQSFERGGTYSSNEIIYYKEEIEKLNEEVIKKDMEERNELNSSKLMQVKNNLNSAYEKMEKKYQSINENIQAKESVGKKFGSPKRLANDIIINIKMKCNQAMDGLDDLFNKMNDYIDVYNKKKSDHEYILNISLPVEIRKKILSINNCIFNYGKYISAFKPELNYSLIRINQDENTDSIELLSKEELDEDEKHKIEELEHLGYLSKFLNLYPQTSEAGDKKKADKDKNQENTITFMSELNGIDEKVKAECAKIYIGEYAKLIANNDKIPYSLNNFLTNLKFELEGFRLKCVRDLRTYSQKIFKFSCEFIPEIIFEFIYKNSYLNNMILKNKIEKEFKIIEESSEHTKQDIYSQLGPYLANPHYFDHLNKIEVRENSRSENFINEINKNQVEVLQNEENFAAIFFKRIINNFEAFTSILDNYIFEEEYISLEDEEYFKERKDYNTLLKLKPENKGNLYLDSKRTFKKIYEGIDRNLLKVNYYEKYNDFMNNDPHVEHNIEIMKKLENEYKKENHSKSITALKLQTNKNLFYSRNKYFKKYVSNFNENLKDILENFDKIRQKELDYQKRFKEILKSVKNVGNGI